MTFAAGSATATVTVDPTVDTSVEPDETVALTLAAGTGYTIGTTAAVVGTITNDDAATTPAPALPPTPPPSVPSTPPPSNITALPGYGVATSSFFYFAAGGWAGWSVPAGKVVLGAKIISPGDSIDDFSVFKAAGPDEVYPHWTFGPAEYGWVMQAKQVNYGVQIGLYYADPAVDLDVNSNNDGKIDPDNGAAGTDDRIEESTDDQGVIVRPGVIVPVGGDRAKMVVDVPKGITATLAFDAAAAAKVKVFAASGAVALDRDRLSTPIVGGSAQTFWIEAFAPSASLADIAFTLTVTGNGVQDSITMTSIEVLVDRINFKGDRNIDIRIDKTTDIGNGGLPDGHPTSSPGAGMPSRRRRGS